MRTSARFHRFTRTGWFLLILGVMSAQAAPGVKQKVSLTDPRRFEGVREWTGTFTTGAQSGGEREVAAGRETYSSTIQVRGRFRLEEHRDPRNGNELAWVGKGEAAVRVSGRKVTRYAEETVTSTYRGDYVDTFTVQITNPDFEAGTYQLNIIRDLWQEQPHRGDAIQRTTVTVNRYGTTTDVSMVPGHSWADDGGAGFGPVTPFPRSGWDVDGTIQSQNDDFLSRDGSLWTTQWNLQPVGAEFVEPLKAVAGGPYRIERGGTIYLDGLLSTGRIRSFHWKFEPADPAVAIPVVRAAGKPGRRVPVVMLAPIRATLTVSDGEREDSDTVTIEVDPRDFRTPFVHKEYEKVHPNSKAPRRIKGHDLTYAGGENVCALDPDYFAKNTIHILHPDQAGQSWEKRGYTVRQVDDAGGPFHGLWFFDSYLMRIEREVLINKYILPNGPPPVRTAKKFYAANKAMGHDVEGYLAAVRRHELLHSELIEAALPASDPGPKLEAVVLTEKAPLVEQADTAIADAEKILSKATEDPLPTVGFKKPMAFPDDATDQYIPMEIEL